MAKTIGAYKGLWKQPESQADGLASDADAIVVAVAEPSTERISIPIKSQTVKAANLQPVETSAATQLMQNTKDSAATQPMQITKDSVAAQPIQSTTDSLATQPMQNTNDSVATQPQEMTSPASQPGSKIPDDSRPQAIASEPVRSAKASDVSSNGPGQETVTHQPLIQESPELLAHRYRLLVLREHRLKLGRDLLDLGHRNPWALAWSSFSSLGRSFRPWAHARIFALGCYLGVEMAPDILQQLRHPLWLGRYRRSMRGLWRLLEFLAQKTGQKPVSRFMFRLFYLCPPLGVLIYEKQLQSVLRKAEGASSVATGMVKATQGQ